VLSASDFGTGQVFLSLLWFSLFFIWIWLLIEVFRDIFRSHDLSGGAKAAWLVGIIVLPFVGVFIYLIARGHKMGEHAARDAAARDEAMHAYIQSAAGTSAADDLSRLADLKERGVISSDEFAQLKARMFAGPPGSGDVPPP
jgi:Phospholipase_D-nuclease N-terminal